jgi:hypothetical protein
MWVVQEVVLGEGRKERIAFTAFVNGVQSLLENAIALRDPISFIVDF